MVKARVKVRFRVQKDLGFQAEIINIIRDNEDRAIFPRHIL